MNDIREGYGDNSQQVTLNSLPTYVCMHLPTPVVESANFVMHASSLSYPSGSPTMHAESSTIEHLDEDWQPRCTTRAVNLRTRPSKCRCPRPRKGQAMTETPILCPQCDHDIDAHDDGLSQRCYPEGVSYCWCRLAPSEIAGDLLAAEPTDAEVERVTYELQGITVNGAPMVTQGAREIAQHLLRAAVDVRRAELGLP